MNIPFVVFDDIYTLLSKYNEVPKMNKKTFIEWYSKGWLYQFKIELNTLIFHCYEPFICNVIRNVELPIERHLLTDEELIIINKEINDIACKFYKIKAFW